jgi:hypothetical protein
MPTIVPSAPNRTSPKNVAGIRTSGSRTDTPVIGIAIAAMPRPMASARSTPPTLKPRLTCQGRIGAESTSWM